MRLTLILESLKANEERKEVGRWIVSTIDEGEFDTENPGALDEFLEKFKRSSKCHVGGSAWGSGNKS